MNKDTQDSLVQHAGQALVDAAMQFGAHEPKAIVMIVCGAEGEQQASVCGAGTTDCAWLANELRRAADRLDAAVMRAQGEAN